MDDKQVMQELIDFRNVRGWKKYHNLKNLAESVNIESAEIMEIFQWKETNAELSENEKTHLKGEIADTLIYLFYMCDKLGESPLELIHKKVEYNQHRTWNFNDEEQKNE